MMAMDDDVLVAQIAFLANAVILQVQCKLSLLTSAVVVMLQMEK